MNFLPLDALPIALVVVLFLIAAAVIAYVGSQLTRVADRLADITGLGEAVFGAVLLGGSTSLPGIVTSVAAASQGYAELAISNALGGIAAQTAFLAIADFAYRKANLEHAAASLGNLLQSALLMTLLAIPLLAMSGPNWSVWAIHPASIVLILAYLAGLRLVQRAQNEPHWRPRMTPATQTETKAKAAEPGELKSLWIRFGFLALIVAAAGYLVAQTGIEFANRTGMSQTVVGGLLTAVSTSLPELVTSIAAVRQGALTLAVGGIIGGNSFDVLFVAFADFAYREDSIFHAITERQIFLIALSILMTGVLLLGLLRRERQGPAGIGFESVLVLALYLGGFLTVVLFL